MNRRDFLFFRTEGSQRVAELSCEKLFMHYQDLSSGFQQAAEEEGSLDGADWWAGEPSLLVNSIEPDVFFRKILEELSEIEAVTVQDMEWLAQGDFRIRVETLLAAFSAGGGGVHYKSPDEKINEEEVSLPS